MRPLNTAIVVFTYNRLDHTKITLENLSLNKGFKDYPVIIYSDGPKLGQEEKVELVRSYLRNFKSKNKNVKIVERDKNIGLEKSIITGITETLESYSSVIVIEDDIKTSPEFLGYMKKNLDLYKDNDKVGCISGYSHPDSLMHVPSSYQYDIFFVPRTSSWGWATWKDRWEDVDWEVSDIRSFIKDKQLQKDFNFGGRDLSSMLIKQVKKGIDTWDIQWCYHNFKKGRLTIYPTTSYVENVGQDGTGVHCGASDDFLNNKLSMVKDIRIPKKIFVDERMVKDYGRVFEMTPVKFVRLAFNKVLKIIRSKLNINLS